jgi:anthranilate synthase/aminodeoxychorismate synthase-like glutamine amidotransferase
VHLLIDNYDSFTFNIAQAFGALGEDVRVVRNDAIDVEGVRALAPQTIIISPGPGRPEDAGVSRAVIARFADTIPILGVCLGHQCIVEVFGLHGLSRRTNHLRRALESLQRHPLPLPDRRRTRSHRPPRDIRVHVGG